ncbi:MAG: protein kinase [Planctomycetales bacterium]|nr:protein kinase [Planctomycetales bacterium]
MSDAVADRNLLVGMLALQLDFVSREQFVAASAVWSRQRETPLAEIFSQQGALTGEESRLLASLVDAHLARHQGDAAASLAALDVTGATRNAMSAAGLADWAETIAQGPATYDPHATGVPLAYDSDATTGTHGDATDVPSPYSETVAQSSTPSRRDVEVRNVVDGNVPLSTPAAVRYSVLKMFSRGGLGMVSLARDVELNREVALKEILAKHADSDEARQRFLVEAEITGSLEHPGVVPVYGLGQYADGRPFYAMRFIRGDNMQVAIDQHFRGQPGAAGAERELQFRQLLGRFVDVCNAIEYAHNRCVLHRDLKPGNIMLGKYGETLVVDWGLAKVIGPEVGPTDTVELPVRPLAAEHSTATQMGLIVGTPAYMSPEQAMGQIDALGPATDIYSLGATLFYLITGEAPFARSDRRTLLEDVRAGRFESPRSIRPSIPRPLEAICTKAMAREVRDRYLTARDLADDIERYLADEPVSAYAEPWRARAWRWMKRRRALVMSTVAALLVTAAALALGLVWSQAAQRREAALRTQAERNLDKARQAVDDYFTNVSEDTLLNQPGMQTLRMNLLSFAQKYYEEFLAENEDNAALRDELAAAEFNLGRILQNIGDKEAATGHFTTAVRLAEAAYAANPAVPQQVLLANAVNALGGALMATGQVAEAREQFARATSLRQELASEEPANQEYQRKLANSLMNQGVAELASGDENADAAIEYFEAAQKVRRDALNDADNFAQQVDLGKGFNNLARLYRDVGNATAALAAVQDADGAFRRAMEIDPRSLDTQENLAQNTLLWGELLAAGNDHAAAEPKLQAASDALATLHEENPAVIDYEDLLLTATVRLAQSQLAIGKLDAAAAHAAEATLVLRDIVAEVPDDLFFREDLAIALAVQGECAARAGDTEAARPMLAEALELLRAIEGESPSAREFADRLATDYANVLEYAPTE